MNEKIQTFVKLLKEYNSHTNIYSKNAYDKLNFHILDSINLAEIIKNKNHAIFDFGSGSGLPAIPIAITNPKNKIYAIESKSRKTSFLSLVKQQLQIENLTIVNKNIFEWVPPTQPKIITAKAFSSLEKITKIIKKLNLKKVTLIIPISYKQTSIYMNYLNTEILTIGSFYYSVTKYD